MFFFLLSFASAERTYVYYAFDTNATVERTMGVNVSDGNASLSIRQSDPNDTVSTTAALNCYNDTRFFVEFNNTQTDATCSGGNKATKSSIANYAWEASTYGTALRLNDGAGLAGKVCWEPNGVVFKDSPKNDMEYVVVFKQYNSTSAVSSTYLFDLHTFYLLSVNGVWTLYLNKAPDGTTYNKDITLGSERVDGDYHTLRVLRSNYTGVSEVAIFLDQELKAHLQGESLAYGSSSVSQYFCLGGIAAVAGTSAADLAFDQVMIRNWTEGHPAWNQTYYGANHTYPLQGMVVLSPITLFNTTNITINATLVVNGSSNGNANQNASKIYVTGFFGPSGKDQNKFIQNATVSYVAENCGKNASARFAKFFTNASYSCTTGATFDGTTIDNIAANGTDMGLEQDPTKISDVASARWTRAVARGYYARLLVIVSGTIRTTQRQEGAARFGLPMLYKPAAYQSANTAFGPQLRFLNCNTMTQSCVNAEIDDAVTYGWWSILTTQNWEDNYNTTGHDFMVNYTRSKNALLLSVRDAQQRWYPELNTTTAPGSTTAQVVLNENRTNVNFTPVLLFMGDGNNTPVLQDLNISWIGQPPTFSTRMNPQTITNTTQELTAYATTTSNDGTSTKITVFYNWTVNGTPNLTGHVGATSGVETNITSINATWTSGGDTWTLSLIGSDNTTNATYNVSNFTINHTWANISSVNFTPEYPNSTRNVTCNYTYNDSDGHLEADTRINWYVNAILIQTDLVSNLGAPPNISETNYVSGDVLNCTVFGNNTYNWTPLRSTAFTITNAGPTATSATFTGPTYATVAYTNDLLTCAIFGMSDPDGDATTGEFEFNDGGILQAFSGTTTLNCNVVAGCDKGDVITCNARATDGTAYSNQLATTTVTINNSRSSINIVSITPALPADVDDLTCAYTTTADPDGDAITKEYQWWKNDVLQVGKITQILANADTTPADLWRCEAIAFDGTDRTKRNSTDVTIAATTPVINLLDANATVNEGNELTVNWTWTSPTAGPYTHYACNTSVIAAGVGCAAGQTLCSATSSTSPADCNVTVASTYQHSNTAYVAIEDGVGGLSSVQSVNYFVNHAPSITADSVNTSTNNVSNTFLCNVTVSDSDNDLLTLSYEFLNLSRAVLRAATADPSYSSNGYDATHGHPIICAATATDGGLTTAYVNQSSNLRIGNISYVNTIVGQEATLHSNSSKTNTTPITQTYLTLESPSGSTVGLTDLAMTDNTSLETWTYSWSPSIAGNWTPKKIFLQSGVQTYSFLGLSGDSLNIATSTSSAPVVGGRLAPEIVTIVTPGENITTVVNVTRPFCGDSLCQKSENPANCWQDCKVNYDTLITCIWDESITCNWEQNWFAVTLIGLVTIITIGALYQYEVRNKTHRGTAKPRT